MASDLTTWKVEIVQTSDDKDLVEHASTPPEAFPGTNDLLRVSGSRYKIKSRIFDYSNAVLQLWVEKVSQ